MGLLPGVVGPPDQKFLLGQGIDLRQRLVQRFRQAQAEAEEGSCSTCLVTSFSLKAVVSYMKAMIRRSTT